MPSNIKTHVVDVEPRHLKLKAVFTVSGGLDAGRILSIPRTEVVSLGRAAECTYPFDDVSLSREHAQVLSIGPDYVLNDTGSTNGSYINEERVTRPTVLKNGDHVRLGSSTQLRFALVDEEEEKALTRVYEAAVRDGLTNVYNRKHLEERIAGELEFARRHGTALSVIILDVDHFKQVNDTYGHLAGDAVLARVAELASREIRTEDVLGRYGGEEFLVVLRGIVARDAVTLSERLRWIIWDALTKFGGYEIRVTVSAGVADLADCGADLDRATLLGIADKRLYQAKETGRNRVVGP